MKLNKVVKRAFKPVTIFILMVFLLEILGAPLAWGCCGREWIGGGAGTGTGENDNDPQNPGQNGPEDGDPVRMNNGNYSREKHLFFYPSRGMPTVISAFYSSQEVAEGVMGLGWSLSYDISITRLSDDTRVILWGNNGRRDRYTPKEGGGFTPPPGIFDTLTWNEAQGSYTLKTKYGTEYLFLSQNPVKIFLSAIKDRNQNTITLNYDQNGRLFTLTDTVGRTFTFNYTGERLTSIGDPDGRSVSFTYTDGLLTGITDPMGNTVHYGYNAQGKISSLEDAMGATYLTQSYDDHDFPRITSQNYGGQNFSLSYNFRDCTAAVTKNGKTTSYLYYPETGFQRKVTDPLNNDTWTTYDSTGNLIQIFDAKYRSTNFSYDSNGNCTSIEQPGSIETTFTYEPNFSQVTAATDPNGNTSAFAYDSNGNRLSATNPLSQTTSFSYDNSGQLTSITDANSHSTGLTYDNAGNMTALTDALQNAWHFGYEARGNLTSAQDPLNHTTTRSYNLNDQPTSVTDPLSHTTSFSYNPNGKLSNVTDANGNTASYEYTILDMISRVTDSMNQNIYYNYNNDGLLSSITNARGNTTSFSYNELERLVQTQDPLSRTTSLGYDEVGNVTSRTDGNSSTTLYSYDGIDRLDSKTFPDQTSVSYGYDAGSRRTTMTDRDNAQTTYSYNNANRLTSVVTRGETVNYTYDNVGNPLSVENPGSSQITNYVYDVLNRLSQVSHNDRVFQNVYDAAGRLTNRLYPNGIATNYEYNECNWLTLMAHVQQNPLLSFQYTHDNVGNRTSKTITDGQGQYVWGYEYDALYRLVTETYPDTHTVTYTYDQNGNRLTRTENGNTINSVYDNADQLLTAGPLEFSYDGNGNQVQKVDHSQGDATTGFMYDYENLLAQITFPDTTTESYLYNGNGLRVQKSRSGITTNYLLSGSDVLNEWSSQGGPPPTYYILGGSMAGPLALQQPGEQGPVYHYSHTDGLGSIHMLTDDPANITDGYGYDAFGVGMTPPNPPPNTTYNPYRYTGQQTDFSGSLVYLRARYYDPQVGRFISQDPIGFSGGMNFYAYCGGNPVKWVDPWGLDIYLVHFENGMPISHLGIAVTTEQGVWYFDFNKANPRDGSYNVPGEIRGHFYESLDAMAQDLKANALRRWNSEVQIETRNLYENNGSDYSRENAILNQVRSLEPDPMYNAIGYNCVDFVLDALAVARIYGQNDPGGIHGRGGFPLTPREHFHGVYKAKK
ncbi:MAG: RHS repeat-associated core domain-containing protein [bacterium]